MKHFNVQYYFVLFLFIFSNNRVIFSQKNDPVIRFGIIADIQYCNCESSGTRFYTNSLKKTKEAINHFNEENVDFSINLGDLSDREFTDLDSVLIRLNQANHTVYNTTGNHDYHGIASNKQLYKKLKMPAEYYSFSKGKWVFIVLNTNEISSYSNIKGTSKEKELSDMIKVIQTSERKNNYSWNGGISRKQMEWLDKLLKRAEKRNKNVLIFSHHPLYPEFGLTALNGKEILEIINKYTCIKAMFAGHHHEGEFAFFNNIPAITVEGIVETENENAYGIVEIYTKKLYLKGKGRMSSNEFNLE